MINKIKKWIAKIYKKRPKEIMVRQTVVTGPWNMYADARKVVYTGIKMKNTKEVILYIYDDALNLHKPGLNEIGLTIFDDYIGIVREYGSKYDTVNYDRNDINRGVLLITIK